MDIQEAKQPILIIADEYVDWLQRFQRVLSAYNQGLINPEQLEAFQIFLLEFGQYNANFTLDELERLKYPRSPFAIMHTHAYLRAIDTWAMEILQIKYKEEYEKIGGKPNSFPIFVDSILFWKELKRYCTVIDETNIADCENIVHTNVPIWVEINKGETKEIDMQKSKISREMRKIIEKKLLYVHIAENKISDKLIPFFEKVLYSVSINKYEKFSSDELKELKTLFPDIEKHNLKLILKSSENDIFKNIFSLAKINTIKLPENIKNPEELKAYFETKSEEFITLLDEICLLVLYVEKGKAWIKKNIISSADKILRNSIYFFQDSFHEIQTIVFCDTKKDAVPGFITSLMGNIGYRIDPVKAIRKALKDFFPLLFIDAEETRNFLDIFFQLPLIAQLPQKEKNIINTLHQEIISHIKCKFTLEFTKNDILSEKDMIYLGFISNSQNKFKIYAKYLYSSLNEYQKSASSTLRLIADPEIKQSLVRFFTAYENKNLCTAIRQVQTISEILLLDTSNKPLEKTLPDLIKENLNQYPVQGVLVTPYAMRAFVRVFQILGDQGFTIAVTNQSYFEWLHNVERLNKEKNSVSLVYHLRDINQDFDVIFVEIHPNNMVEGKLFSHDIFGLLENIETALQHNKNKKITLVIDATLNALDDNDIQSVLKHSSYLIDSGCLNLIFVQSLTKFFQLGLDQRSAGMIAVINNNKNDWIEVNKRLNNLSKLENVDQSTLVFFSHFAKHIDLIGKYIQAVNGNVRFVYEAVMKKFNNLEVFRKLFQISINPDPQSCCVVLNMNALLAEVDSGFNFGINEIEKFSKDLINHLIIPLCNLFELPITQRMSIGFPLSSLGSVFASIRVTIGLEPYEQLMQYAEVLAYVAFVLNRQNDIQLFFEKDKDKKYSLRLMYFQEKIDQFRALTPEMQFSYEFEFEGTGSDNSYKDRSTNRVRQLKRKVSIQQGNVVLSREIPVDSYGHTRYIDYLPRSISLCVRNYGKISLSGVDISTKRMSIACLTQYKSKDQKENYQNVNLIYDNIHNKVSFENMEIPEFWNAKFAYGPFYVNKKPIFFCLYQKNIYLIKGNSNLLFPDQKYPETLKNCLREENILLKQGNIFTPLLDMSIEEREFLFRVGSYQPDRPALSFCRYLKNFDSIMPNMQYIPDEHNFFQFGFQGNYLTIECDFVCCQMQGATVYERSLGKGLSCFEIDIWEEKDPVLARFMRLLIAIYIKEKYDVEFLARNNRFTHFVFNIPFKSKEALFSEAIESLLNKKHLLKDILLNDQRSNPSTQYLFNRNASVSWPSSYSGVSYVNNKGLIDSALSIIKSSESLQKKTASDTKHATVFITPDNIFGRSMANMEIQTNNLDETKIGNQKSYKDELDSTFKNWEQMEFDIAIQNSLKEYTGNLKQKLSNEASLYGFDCQDVKGDGNCFFHAVVLQLKNNSSEFSDLSVDDIKEKSLCHIMDNLEEYAIFFEEENDIFISKLLDGEWADHLFIHATAKALNITIAIIHSDATPPKIINKGNTQMTIFLGHEVVAIQGISRGLHYQSLIQNKNLTPSKSIIERIDNVDVDNFGSIKPKAIQISENNKKTNDGSFNFDCEENKTKETKIEEKKKPSYTKISQALEEQFILHQINIGAYNEQPQNSKEILEMDDLNDDSLSLENFDQESDTEYDIESEDEVSSSPKNT